MKKLMALLLVLMAVMLCTAALADGVATVTEIDYTVVDRGDGKAGTWLVGTVENTGDATVYVSGMVVHLKDAAGNVFNEKKNSGIYPSYLDPGDKGYFLVFQNVSDVPSMDAIADYDLTVETKSTKMNRYYQDTTGTFELKGGKETNEVRVEVSVTNQDDVIRSDYVVAYALYDQDGKIMYTNSMSVGSVGLMPGSTMVVTLSSDSSLGKQWYIDGRIPTSVQTVAYTKK